MAQFNITLDQGETRFLLSKDYDDDFPSYSRTENLLAHTLPEKIVAFPVQIV